MAVHCEFIDFIIPIAKIDAVYPGGFKAFKVENQAGFKGKDTRDIGGRAQ